MQRKNNLCRCFSNAKWMISIDLLQKRQKGGRTIWSGIVFLKIRSLGHSPKFIRSRCNLYGIAPITVHIKTTFKRRRRKKAWNQYILNTVNSSTIELYAIICESKAKTNNVQQEFTNTDVHFTLLTRVSACKCIHVYEWWVFDCGRHKRLR